MSFSGLEQLAIVWSDNFSKHSDNLSKHSDNLSKHNIEKEAKDE